MDLPPREEILAFVRREQAALEKAGIPAKIGRKEVGRHFGITGSAKIDLKRVLKEMEAEGEIARTRKSLHRPGALPGMVLVEIRKRDRDGDLVATPVEWDEDDHGPAPEILIPTRRLRPGERAPGIGQRALVKVSPTDEEQGPAYHGRVVKLLAAPRQRVLGIFRAEKTGPARIIPVDKKSAGRELLVPEGAGGDAKDGDLVAVDLRKEGRFGPLAAVVTEVLGSMKSEKAVSMIALRSHGIPDRFRPATLTEADEAKAATLAHREDWRHLPLVTIDPADAKDHDDAVHAAPDEDPDNAGGHVVTVAIADVSQYVQPRMSMDREALERGNSVYFPDRVVPMLPERISNDLCSLREKEDRPALAVRMILAKDGRKIRHSFHRIMMRSVAKLAYPQAQAAIDGMPDDKTADLLEPVLKPLWAAYESAAAARERRQPLDLDLPERKILLKPDGTVDRVITPERLAAHRLIEEFMILANVAAAETLEQRRQPLIYRVHDEPSIEKLNALAEFLASINIRLAKGQALKPAQFNGILGRVKDGEHETLVNEVVLRTQAQAEYAAENYGHFGLNLRRYAHFTSPIRRYADLIVHRALVRALHLGPGGLPDTSVEELSEIAATISAAERRAMAAERETVDRLIAGFMADKIGATFTGRISGVTRAGLFIKLHDTGADGFAPAATLGRDYYAHDERTHSLIGSATGETFRLGDDVEVKLVEAAPLAGALRFEVLSDGRSGPSRAARMGRKEKPEKKGKSSRQRGKSRTGDGGHAGKGFAGSRNSAHKGPGGRGRR